MEPTLNPQELQNLGQNNPTPTFNEVVQRSNQLVQIGSRLVPIATKVQSPNYRAGTTGWKLDSSGTSEVTAPEGSIPAGNLSGVVTVTHGGTGAATLTGILKGNGTSSVTAITPLAGTKVYYVSDSSGGATNRKLTFTDGILTSET